MCKRNQSKEQSMTDEDEDLMVSLFFVAFAIFITFFVGLATVAVLWSWL